MLNKIFNGQSKSITSAAILIGGASLASRFLGLLRDRILAGTFGAGAKLDMYYAAFNLPDMVYNLLILGALSAGFIPIFVSYVKHYNHTDKNHEAWELANNILNIIIVALIIICGLLIILAPILVKIITPGFNLEQQIITTKLIRIMFLSPIFLGLSAIFGGILQSFKRFFIYAFAPVFYNLGIIIGALYLVKSFGIYGLAWGVVLGAFLHFISQLIAVVALGYRYQKIIDFKHSGAKKIMKMMAPRTLTLAVTQINLVVITIVASTLTAGSLTIFNLANNLQSFPIGIFGLSFAVAAFPTLSALATSNDKRGFVQSFSNVFRQIIFFIVPATLLFIVLRVQIVRIVLGSGNFNWTDTIATMNVLTLFCLSLIAQSLSPLLVRGFYAHHDSQTPFYIAIISTIINITLSLFFAKALVFGVYGLALAFSLSSWFNTILLLIALRSKIGKLDGLNIFYTTIKITFSAIIAAIIIESYKFIIEPFTGTETLISLLIQTAISASIGLLVYGSLCFLLQVAEINIFLSSFKKKLLRPKALPEINIGEESDVNK